MIMYVKIEQHNLIPILDKNDLKLLISSRFNYALVIIL